MAYLGNVSAAKLKAKQQAKEAARVRAQAVAAAAAAKVAAKAPSSGSDNKMLVWGGFGAVALLGLVVIIKRTK